ncbi:MAG: hypothetical protein IPM38_08785 [Ignavibacteria bacterium]|nr:hypothetical protein [Ignavibacteria bacterium]
MIGITGKKLFEKYNPGLSVEKNNGYFKKIYKVKFRSTSEKPAPGEDALKETLSLKQRK